MDSFKNADATNAKKDEAAPFKPNQLDDADAPHQADPSDQEQARKNPNGGTLNQRYQKICRGDEAQKTDEQLNEMLKMISKQNELLQSLDRKIERKIERKNKKSKKRASPKKQIQEL